MVLFSVTDVCNATCDFCTFWHTKHATAPAEETIDETIHNIYHRLGCGYLQFTGGETLLYPHIERMISAAARYPMITQLMTNGGLLKPAKIERLAAAGLGSVTISIDHWNASIFDAHRGIPGLSNRIATAIPLLHANGLVSSGGITIARHNVDDLEAVATQWLDRGMDMVYFSLPVSSTGSSYQIGTDIDGVIDFTPSEMIAVIERIKQLKKELGSRLLHHPAFLEDAQRYYRDEVQQYPCKGGENVFYVDHTLTVFDCMTRGVALGHINGTLETLHGTACTDCPIQCFRESSTYYQGISSLPFFGAHFRQAESWKLLGGVIQRQLKQWVAG